jgi:exopolysaccharide biosynthesis polyprenyl glycosylphosphotransferase
MDSPTQSVLINPGSHSQAPPARTCLRLVKPETATLAVGRNWFGSFGNSLLEMPWMLWSAFDVAVLSFSLYLAYRVFVWTPTGGWVPFSWWQMCMLQAPALTIAGLVFGLYEQKTLLRRSRILARSVLTVTTSLALTYIVIYFLMYSVHSRRVMFLAMASYLAFAPTFRLFVCAAVNRYSRKFLIVGTDRKSQLSPDCQGDGLSKRYQLVGYVTTDVLEVGREIGKHPVLGTVDEIERICLEQQVDEVVVGRVASKNPWVVDKALRCLKIGCRVTNLSTFYEDVLSEVPAALLEPHWFLFADFKHYHEAQLIMKRASDIVFATLGLILTLPFWPLVALLIRLDSPGPVFYSQIRVGLLGRHFRLYKFRTMMLGSEKNGHTWAVVNDPRVTRVGRYLRKLRIDELPQLLNVLMGAMAIVGPRPERPEFVDELADKIRFYNERHVIKPGLTGWAQINYRYGASVEDAQRKLQLDLWYIKHMCLELDLTILLRTVGTLFIGSR